MKKWSMVVAVGLLADLVLSGKHGKKNSFSLVIVVRNDGFLPWWSFFQWVFVAVFLERVLEKGEQRQMEEGRWWPLGCFEVRFFFVRDQQRSIDG